MTFAIYAQTFKPSNKSIIEKLLFGIEQHQGNIIFEENYYHALIENKVINKNYDTFNNHNDLSDQIDFFISIGGDGTMLRASNFIKNKNIPVVGINAGRLGFLANVQQEMIDELIPTLVSNNFKISKRTLLKLDTDNGVELPFEINSALNEITISRKNTTSMISIETHINGEFLATYWADGIIISTPTGSTGYSLSCGGPIITPDSNCLVITPIAPHNLTTRPLIINDNSKITMKVNGREKQFLISLDSETHAMSNETKISISLAPHTVNMVEFPNVTFLKTLRNKLLWGEDKRN